MSRYLALTRSHTYSVLFALPLLALYEVGAVYIARAEGSNLRNGADVLLRTLLAIGGVEGSAVVTLVVIAAAALIVITERRRRSIPLRIGPFFGMTAESVLYAAIFGVVVGAATRWLLEGIALPLASAGPGSLSLTEGIVLSLGAGLYEEIVFRVLLAGGLFGLFQTGGLSSGKAGLFAVILSALIFSGFHYVGPFGDVLALPSFIFRFLAGVVFSLLFLTRGFGITAWTHALYDVFLVLALNVP